MILKWLYGDYKVIVSPYDDHKIIVSSFDDCKMIVRRP